MPPESVTRPSILTSFEDLANTSPYGILVLDTKGNCSFVNQTWCRITNSSKNEHLGESWLDFVDEKAHAEIRQAIKNVSSQTLKFHLQNVATPAYTLRLSLLPESSKKNPVIAAWIEEQHTLAKRVIDQPFDFDHRAQLIEAVLDSTISMISVIDRNFRLVYVNRQVEEYTGAGRDLVLGRNIFEVFPYLLTHTDVKLKVAEALQGKTVQSEVEESVLKKGKYFESFYIPLYNDEREIEGVIIKVRDRTIDTRLQQQLMETNKLLAQQNKELIKQSHFIQSVFDSTIDVIAVIDSDLRYISINRKAVERYGFTKEQIEGKKLLDLFPSVKESGMYRDIQRALKGELVYDLSYTSKVLNKAQFENYYVPLKDDQDNVYAVMVIGHDITDVVRGNEELRIANQRLLEKNRDLERSNRDLEQFAYVASHDLQEPIRKIATYSNKLLTRSKESLSEETITYLERISNSTRRMYELINGLLAYSRLTRQEDLFTTTSLDGIVRQLVADYDLKIREKKAIVSIQNRLPEIEAIPVQMTQLFANLISNSLKFAKQDVTPVIQIAAMNLDAEQIAFYELDPRRRYVTIIYVDNGIGFDQQFTDKIFDLFQRLHEKNKYEGSGIGLAICKKIINNHHGVINAFSEEGKGATFQLILPYVQAVSPK